MVPGGSEKPLQDHRRQRWEKCIRFARNKLDKGDLPQGYRWVAIAASIANDKNVKQDKQLKDQSRNLLSDCNQAAGQRLTEAGIQYHSGNFTESLATYRVVSTMTKISSATRAEENLELSRIDPRMVSAMQEVNATNLYERVNTLLSITDRSVACCDHCGSPSSNRTFRPFF